MVLEQFVVLLLQFLDAFAFLILAAVGLAVIFGMLGVINLAHGEFITIGAYGTALSYHAGLPLVISMVVGVLAAAVFGAIIERTIIRKLYGRLLDSMVATWGISLILLQGLLIIFGPSLDSIGTPFGTIQYGNFSYSTYRVLLSGVSLAILAGLYALFAFTDYGLRARATISNEEMAKSLGVDTDRMYFATFALGSGLAGLTGALYAPTMTIVPGMGSSFLVEAFVLVIVGGTAVIIGTTIAGGFLGGIYALFTNLYGTFVGRIALLITTVILIRILPQGITGLIDSLREQYYRSDGSVKQMIYTRLRGEAE